MQMTNIEIVREYKLAANKKKQIEILAELNECTKDEIVGILKVSPEIDGRTLNGILGKKKAQSEEQKEYTRYEPTEEKNVQTIPIDVVNAVCGRIEELLVVMGEAEEAFKMAHNRYEKAKAEINVLNDFVEKNREKDNGIALGA